MSVNIHLDVKTALENTYEGIKFLCDFCEYPVRSKRSFREHIWRNLLEYRKRNKLNLKRKHVVSNYNKWSHALSEYNYWKFIFQAFALSKYNYWNLFFKLNNDFQSCLTPHRTDSWATVSPILKCLGASKETFIIFFKFMMGRL